MLSLSKSIVCVLLSLLCASSVCGDTGRIEWFQGIKHDSVLQQKENSQLIVRYRPSENVEVFGLAFVAEGWLLSASHVFSRMKVGEDVEIGQHLGLGSEIFWSKAKLIAVSPIDDLALLIPHDRSVLVNSLSVCQKPAIQSTLLVTTKFLTDGTSIRGSVSAPVVTTPLKVLPQLNNLADQNLSPGQIPLSAMAGQPRIVAVGNAAGGHSGGALFDVEHKCVVGVVSANLFFDWLANRDAILQSAENPPYISFLVGIPFEVVRSFIEKQ